MLSICLKWMAAILQAKDSEEWTYRGEGAVNLVLAYCGSSPHFVRFYCSHFPLMIGIHLLKLIVGVDIFLYCNQRKTCKQCNNDFHMLFFLHCCLIYHLKPRGSLFWDSTS